LSLAGAAGEAGEGMGVAMMTKAFGVAVLVALVVIAIELFEISAVLHGWIRPQ
jgi:hypothetical protein